jgi:hypothetical protein
VKVQRGPATVRGKFSFTATAIHCSSGSGKEKESDDPQARRPACFAFALISFGSKEKVRIVVDVVSTLCFPLVSRESKAFFAVYGKDL